MLQYTFCWKIESEWLFSSPILASYLPLVLFSLQQEILEDLRLSQPAYLTWNDSNSSALSESYVFWNTQHSSLSSGLYPSVSYLSWVAASKSTYNTAVESSALLSLALSFCHAQGSSIESPGPDIWFFWSEDQLLLLPSKAYRRGKAFFHRLLISGNKLAFFTNYHHHQFPGTRWTKKDSETPYSCQELGSTKY